MLITHTKHKPTAKNIIFGFRRPQNVLTHKNLHLLQKFDPKTILFSNMHGYKKRKKRVKPVVSSEFFDLRDKTEILGYLADG